MGFLWDSYGILVECGTRGTLGDPVGSFGVLWYPAGPFEILWDPVGDLGIPRDPRGFCGVVWGLVDPLGSRGYLGAKRRAQFAREVPIPTPPTPPAPVAGLALRRSVGRGCPMGSRWTPWIRGSGCCILWANDVTSPRIGRPICG